MYTWIKTQTVLAIHDEQLAEHGGLPGVRDYELLESALMRPQQLANFGNPSVPELAASYALGILQSHPFLDGNKRTAAVLAELFLELHGMELDATDADLFQIVDGCAAGVVSPEELTAFYSRSTAGVEEGSLHERVQEIPRMNYHRLWITELGSTLELVVEAPEQWAGDLNGIATEAVLDRWRKLNPNEADPKILPTSFEQQLLPSFKPPPILNPTRDTPYERAGVRAWITRPTSLLWWPVNLAR